MFIEGIHFQMSDEKNNHSKLRLISSLAKMDRIDIMIDYSSALNS